MISMLVILAVFVLGIAGLAVLGRRVPHPDDERLFAEKMADLRAGLERNLATVGAELVDPVRALTDAFEQVAEAARKIPAAMAAFARAYDESFPGSGREPRE